MAEVVIHVEEAKLLKAVGKTFKKVLESLVAEGLLKSYAPTITLTFDKAMARHIQSILEFHDVQNVTLGPSGRKKESDE